VYFSQGHAQEIVLILGIQSYHATLYPSVNQ
jgi:hypothetical protein